MAASVGTSPDSTMSSRDMFIREDGLLSAPVSVDGDAACPAPVLPDGDCAWPTSWATTSGCILCEGARRRKELIGLAFELVVNDDADCAISLRTSFARSRSPTTA